MALTPAQIDALPDYTNAQMVKLLRYTIAEVANNPEATVQWPGGRGWTMADMDKLQRMLAAFEKREAADADAAAYETTGCPVVSRQEEQT